MSFRRAAATVVGTLVLSIVFLLLAFTYLLGPVGQALLRPGQALYSALPYETAAAIFGYEGQGPHHYLWALCTVVFWWAVFGAATLAVRFLLRRRNV